MSTPMSFVWMDRMTKTRKSIDDKKNEIEKRREVVQTMASTSSAKKKEEGRIQLLDVKIEQKTAKHEKTIQYYRTEIETARKRAEDEIAVLEAKFEAAKKKVEDKFSTYQLYCQQAIQHEEEKMGVSTQPLEVQKEMLEQSLKKTEEDDKTLVRLKIELDQLEKRLEEEQKNYEVISLAENHQRSKRQEEMVRMEMEKLQQIQAMENEKAMAELNYRKAMEKKEEQERKERYAEMLKKEEAVQKAKMEEKKESLNNRQRFIKDFYPNLSPEATANYITLKDIEAGLPSALYKDAHVQDTLEDCEQFLLGFSKDLSEMRAFEQGGLKRWTVAERDVYETLGFYDRLKIMRIKDKVKRRDFLAKFEADSESTADA